MQLHYLRAVGQTVAAELDKAWLRLAPVVQGFRPLMRPPQIEDRAAALDDGAVDHTRDDWRNLAIGDRDHVLVEIRDTRGDVTESDDLLSLGTLPVVQWHYDTVTRLPDGAVLMASSDRYAVQAFRLGDSAWGVQFHPEVTLAQIESWIDEDEPVPDDLLEETRARIGQWNELGRTLCDAFVDVAERVATPV